jgi:hypothetical protein
MFHSDFQHVREESRTLATPRDTLLPRMLSEELSVAAIEKETAA